MREETRTLYTINELSPAAREKAIDKNRDWNVMEDWWDGVYDDASQIGLKITSFDLGRGHEIGGEFTESAESCAHSIVGDHGHDCETFKTANAYLTERDELLSVWPKDDDGEFEDVYLLDDKLDDLDDEFLHAILEDYLVILSHEYDYLTSDEAIVESLETNEVEFTEDGGRP